MLMLIGLYLFYLHERFGSTGQKLLGGLNASGLTTVILFSSRFLLVGVGAVWRVKEMSSLSLLLPFSVPKNRVGE